MIDAFFSGLVLVLQWPAIGYLTLGVGIGMWLGAVPGLGGVIGLVLLLPFTFGMDPVSAFSLLLGMYAVTTTSDTIASVLLGVPGTAASQATILDGYPLAQKGEAQRALGAAFSVSAFGGVTGAFVLAASLPLILPIILSFGNPEVFMLGLLGLSMVGSLSGGSVLKGLAAALLGLLLTTIGYHGGTGVPRYWFGADYLLDGLPLIPVVLGLFAIPELLELATRNTSISRVAQEDVRGVTVFTGMRDTLRHWWLATRCAAIGTYVGILPGLGASISDWIAYAHAVQSARDKSNFGKGDIRGVIAPEAANNAVKGGALIPTVAFGIPGNVGTAILMGALLIQGLKPGPEMLIDKLDITFSMVWAIVVANLLAAALLLAWSKQVAKLAFVRGHLIVPAAIVFVFMGAWLAGTSMGDWITCLVAGVVGFVMKRSGWPRPPLVLALILGGILENAFHITMRSYGGFSWLTHPIVFILLVLIVITIGFAARGILRARRDGGPETGEGYERNALLSLPLTVVLTIMFIGAIAMSLEWSAEVRRFPLTVALPAVFLCSAILLRDLFEVRKIRAAFGGWQAAIRSAAEASEFQGSLIFLGYLLGIILATLLIGQIAALCLFVAVYLWRWGGFGWRLCGGYAAVTGLFVYGFYGEIMNIFWRPSPLDFLYSAIGNLL